MKNYRFYLEMIAEYMKKWNEPFTLSEIKATARARYQRDRDTMTRRYGWE